MEIHIIKADEVDIFVEKDPKMALNLLLVGLAETLSNSQMFGGTDSTSFKIKNKRINQRAKKIIKKYLEVIDE